MKAFEAIERARNGSIPPELRATIIDKPRIAEAHLERARGLREAGNPHIQKGEDLLLPDMREDPKLARVDTARLHEEQVSLVSRRLPRKPLGRSSQALPAAEGVAEPAPAPAPPAQAKGSGSLDLVVPAIATASAGLALGGLLYYLKRRKA